MITVAMYGAYVLDVAPRFTHLTGVEPVVALAVLSSCQPRAPWLRNEPDPASIALNGTERHPDGDSRRVSD